MGVSSSCPCRREKAAAPSKTSANAHNASSVGEGEAAAPAPASDYERAMRSLLVAPVDLSADALLTSMAHGVINHPASVVQRISKELRELRNNLPCSSASSIFVRYDKKRPYFMKALITGPEDTPYDSGAFVFDVFFPATYPTAPPTVLLRTTGGGTVRFNPNLYNCGKVCLSLLGTWSGSHACEKWSQQSSLLQVLVSIQGLILVKFPYFNEPGRREMLPHTPEVKYDNNGGYYHVRKNNLRWAIADAISSPPAPFAEIIHRHFSLKVAHILKVAQVWTDDDLSSHYTGEMKGVVKILKQSLATLPPPPAPEAAKPKPLPAAGATESKEDTPADEPDAAEEEAVLATGKARRRGGRAVRGTVKAAKPSATAPPPTQAAKTATIQPAAKPAVAAPLPSVSEGEWVMVTPKKHRARRVLMSDSSVELVEA